MLLRAKADQAFLRRRRDEPAVLGVDHAAREAARALRGRAVAGIQKPFVDAERTMEPERVIEARHLHVLLQVRDAVRERRRADQMEIGGVREHRTLQNGIVRRLVGEPEPHVLVGRLLAGIELAACF